MPTTIGQFCETIDSLNEQLAAAQTDNEQLREALVVLIKTDEIDGPCWCGLVDEPHNTACTIARAAYAPAKH